MSAETLMPILKPAISSPAAPLMWKLKLWSVIVSVASASRYAGPARTWNPPVAVNENVTTPLNASKNP